MEKNKLKIKSNIEKSQIYLINKTFFFFQYLKKKKICLAKSSFSYLSSYGNTLGTGLLNYWLKKNFFVLLICILKNILSISTLKYLTLTKIKIVNFENIIITWGKIADFENGKFKDIFLVLFFLFTNLSLFSQEVLNKVYAVIGKKSITELDFEKGA